MTFNNNLLIKTLPVNPVPPTINILKNDYLES